MKHGSSWSVFLSAASYCIWQVEISYPTSLPRNPIDQYPPEVLLCVFFILNFMIANTVFSKKSYFRLNIWWDVIYVQREQQGTKKGVLGDTRQNRNQVRFYSIHNNSFSEAKKRIYPFQCLATSSIAKQFALKEFMRGCIKCLFKIQYERVHLSSVVQDFSPVIYYRSQLSFITDLSWMHVAHLTGVYIHQDEPWYLNILCVRVTCKVHKSRKPGDNCTQVTCHSSWKGGRYLGFHQCPLIAGKDEQIPVLTLLLAPLVHQALKL